MTHLIEHLYVLCTGNTMAFPSSQQHRAISWSHHYLQHLGAAFLWDTLCATVYLKDMHNVIQRYVKNCHKCQVNKWHTQNYGKAPTKLVIQNPWHALFVGRIWPYTFDGKDGTEVDFMCLIIIDPATSWLDCRVAGRRRIFHSHGGMGA